MQQPDKAGILYITYDGLTDPLGQSQIIPYLAGISKAGYRITVISCEKESRKNQTDAVKKTLKENDIYWISLRYTKSPPVLSTIFDVWKIRRAARKEYKRKPFRIVHCRSYIASLAGLSLKKSFGIKFIFDMRGFWADERVEGGLWKLNNPVFKMIYSFFKKKENEFLTNADYIISLTENAADEIHSWRHLPNQPLAIQVIPCCVDMNLFDPAKISEDQIISLKRKLDIQNGDFVLSYIGSIGTWYLRDEMLLFFRQLISTKPSTKFLFITNDPSESILIKATDLNIPKDKIIIQQAERNEMPLFIKCSNLSVFFIKPSFSKKASSPVKQGEIMSMGIPIVCNAGVGDTDKIIQDSGAGVVVTETTEKYFAEAIGRVNDLLKIPPVQIRNGAEKYYSLEKGTASYINVYNELLKK